MAKLGAMRRILWGMVGVALLAAGALYLFDPLGEPRTRVANTDDGQSMSAEFALTDQTGATVTDTDFRGRWMLVFFGFTNCPDICPLGLANIARAMDQLGEDAEKVAPIFISIDPERDDPEAVGAYADQFEAGITGLAGSKAEIAQAAESFSVYYEKIADETAPDGYTMGHTSAIFLVDPEGRFMRTFDYNAAAGTLVDDLEERV